ncbi:MAG: hypothetical protein GY822_15325, partial [Deltaproteobacteria bacterium]|nr:hypothetical protein [Deltaproteobacteria bacterium]
VTDGDDSDSEDFTITVSEVNNAPTIDSTAGTTAIEAVEYTYAATVTDVDALDVNDGNGSLVWSLSGEPTGMAVSSTGVVTWTPADGILTSETVTLTVTDGDASDSEDFTITVAVVVDTSYILNYEASSELFPSDGTWDYVTGQTDFDFEVSNATLNNSPQTNYSGISQAYRFDGSSGGGSMPPLESISGDPTDSDASFELWFRPDSLSGEQILFETGAFSAGMVLYLSGNNLVFATKGNF